MIQISFVSLTGFSFLKAHVTNEKKLPYANNLMLMSTSWQKNFGHFSAFQFFYTDIDLRKHNIIVMWVHAAYIANKIILQLISSSMKATCSSIGTEEQSFSQNLKSCHPKCLIGPAQMSSFRHIKNKTIFFISKWLSTGCLDAHLPKSPLRNHCPCLNSLNFTSYIYTCTKKRSQLSSKHNVIGTVIFLWYANLFSTECIGWQKSTKKSNCSFKYRYIWGLWRVHASMTTG